MLHRLRQMRRGPGAGLLAALLAAWGAVSAHAADKNGVSPNVVVLPSGPGSIRGLGDNFAPEPGTGVAQYEFAFSLPPAHAMPDIRLEYNGGSGDGPLSIGWNLHIPFVQRETVMVLPRYIDEDDGSGDDGEGDEYVERDRFVSELHEYPFALVPGEDGYYLGENEGPFVRYRRVGEHWEGTEPDGRRLWFGETASGRVSDPDTGGVFTWKLEREEDTNGNTVRYFHESFPGEANLNTSYLTRVEYGPGQPPWDHFHFLVLNYEQRPGFIEDGEAGFVRRTGMRLREVLVCTQGPVPAGHAEGDFNGDGVADYLNSRYVLAYEGHPFWTLLTSITQYGADNVSALPPLAFEYTLLDPPAVLSATSGVDGRSGILNSLNTPLVLFTSDAVEITELNGDGLPDMLRTFQEGGLHTAYLNLGEAGDEDARHIAWSAGVPIGGDPRVRTVTLAEGATAEATLADFSGDGRSDLCYKAGARDLYYFPQEVVGGLPAWGERVHFNIDPEHAAPPASAGDGNVVNEDINGDVLMDVLQCFSAGGRSNLRVWLSVDGERYAPPFTVEQDFTYLLTDDGVSLEDFNGDELPDFVRITSNRIEVAPGLGYGRFGPVQHVPIPGGPLNTVHVKVAALEDVTSSGLPDLLIANSSAGELWYWVNRGNYTLDEKRVIRDLPVALSHDGAIRWADMNGNGTADYVYADNLAEERLQVVDIGQLIGCVPSPNLLVRIDNGIGAVTEISYRTSVAYQLEDNARGEPWQDPMPAPVDVVAEVTTHDSLGNSYTRRMAYHDGFYDSSYLVFGGFRRTSEFLESADPAAPPLMREFEYDVGDENLALRGSILRETESAADGAVYWEEQTVWDVRVVLEGVNDSQALFAHPVSRTRDILEGGTGEPRRILTEYEYDDYGNVVESRDYGVVDGDDRGAYGDERIERTEYAINPDAWIIRLPARVEVLSLDGEVVERTEHFYDDETFSGENLGEVARGNETLVRRWRDPADPAGHVVAKRVAYDEYGNQALILDPMAEAVEGVPAETAGHFRRVDYDGAFHHLPVRETIVLGAGEEPLAIEADYDPGFGVVVASRDWNGNETAYGYDAFGRFARSVRPGDSEAFPTVEYSYVLAVPFAGGLVSYVETRLLDRQPVPGVGEKADYYAFSRLYVDGMGRELQTRREAEPGTGGAARVAVSSAVRFNARGKKALMLQPFFSSAAGVTLQALLEYEDTGAPGWEGLFHVDGSLVRRGLADAPRTETEYDALMRPVRTVNADGSFRVMEYRPLVTAAFDENDVGVDPRYAGTPIFHYTDGLGRLVRVDETVRAEDGLETYTTRYAWRHDGQLLQITDSQENTKWYAYDGLGRKTLQNDINQGITRFEYDEAGNLVRTVDAMERVITYTYDGANRLRTEDYHDEAFAFSGQRVYDPALPIAEGNLPDVAYFYDTPVEGLDLGDGTAGTASYARGHLAYVLDLSGETHFSYDARDNVVWTVKRLPDEGTGLLVSYMTGMSYDSMDRVTGLGYPDGDRVRYAYNERNLLASITGGSAHNLNGRALLLGDTAYAPSEQRVRFVYGNGVRTTYAYDARGRLSRLSGVPASGPDQALIDYAYVYDGVSNLEQVRDGRPAGVRPAGDPRRNTQLFEHDALYRLIGVTFSLNAPGEPDRDDGAIGYAYDPLGNMVRKSSGLEHDVRGVPVANLGEMRYGGPAGTAGRTGRNPDDPPGPHALTEVGEGETLRAFSYDARGNMTEADGLALTWDFKDRLVVAEDADMRAWYLYDYTDRRVAKRVRDRAPDGNLTDGPARVTLYIDAYFEVRDNGQPTKYVFAQETRIAKATGTLDTAAERVQRFSLPAGWNLCRLLVDAPGAAAQLGIGEDGPVEAAFLWDEETRDYVELTAQSLLRAGAVFWLRLGAPAVRSVRGVHVEPAGGAVVLSAGYVPQHAFERTNLESLAPEESQGAWGYSATLQTWQARVPGELAFLSDLPDFAAPGQPVYLQLDGQVEVDLPPSRERIQYYHPDHLGSASLLSDGEGNVLEETVYYPFGEIRHQSRASAVDSPSPNRYLFAQKERDEETTLQYFEARYLAAPLGRFNRVDPAVEAVPTAALEDPQLLHAYAYARNNPVTVSDPDGRFAINPAGRTLFRQLRPFSDQATGNFTDTKLERRARVFGALRFEKGESFPSVGTPSLPAPFAAEANKLRGEASLSANALISGVTSVANQLSSRFPAKGKGALDASSFLDTLTRKGGNQDNTALLAQYPVLGSSGDLTNSPITAMGRAVDEKAAREITVLQDTVKSIDLNAKYQELIGKVNESGKAAFTFDQAQVDAFIDKYVQLDEDAEDQNRDRKKEEERE